MVEHATENRSVRSPILRLGTGLVLMAVTGVSTPRYTGKETLVAMKTTTVEHATLQIVSGTVYNTVNNFLIERRSRGLSMNTIWYYTRYLNEFCQCLDPIGVINPDELTADVIR